MFHFIKRTTSKIFLFMVLCVWIVSYIFSAQAASTSTSPTTQRVYLGLAERVNNFYIWAIGLGGMLALALIIYGGVLYSASGGNPGRMTEAKTWIQQALFGLALLLASYLILNFINPDLTTLDDVFVESNPEISRGGLEFERGGAEYAQCIAEALEGVVTYDNCGGYYLENSAVLARAGNFGDPRCEKKTLEQVSRTKWEEAIEIELRRTLDIKLNCAANVNYLVNIFINDVIPGESGFNPNALLLGKGCEQGREGSPEPTGAWGLFQMSKSGQAEGDVPWREQVKNAVDRLTMGIEGVDRGGQCYWATWPGRIGGECPCPTCLPRYIVDEDNNCDSTRRRQSGNFNI